MIAREIAAIPFTAAADLTGLDGTFVKMNTDNKTVVPVAAPTDIPLGVLASENLMPGTGQTVVVLISDGFSGTTRVKLGATPGAVVPGAYGVLNADGSVSADPGTGARVQVCRFVEAGAAGERVEAVVFQPVHFAS